MTTPTPSDYKSTKLGLIPSDWEILKLGEIVDSITNGTSNKQVNFITNYPVTRIETISNGVVNLNKVGYIEYFKGIENYKLQKGDILFSNINSVKHIGKVAFFSGDTNIYHGMNLLLIKGNNKVKKLFLYYLFIFNKSIFEKNCKQAVNQASISQTDIKKLLFGIPPSHVEQQKIADILSSVDALIDDTDAIISHQKKLKKGLLNKLMTEGIGHTDFVSHPKLGKLPKQWKVVKLGEITEIESGGTPSTNIESYWNGNINWISLADTKKKYLIDTERKITNEGLKNSSAKLLPIGTVVFSSRATIGQISILLKESATNQGYKNFICSEKIYNEYLYYCLSRNISKIKSLSAGATFIEISKSQITDFKIPLPPLPEQQKIAEILRAMDADIEREQNYKNSLLRLKHGLMQKLLTGKIRVKF